MSEDVENLSTEELVGMLFGIAEEYNNGAPEVMFDNGHSAESIIASCVFELSRRIEDDLSITEIPSMQGLFKALGELDGWDLTDGHKIAEVLCNSWLPSCNA